MIIVIDWQEKGNKKTGCIKVGVQSLMPYIIRRFVLIKPTGAAPIDMERLLTVSETIACLYSTLLPQAWAAD